MSLLATKSSGKIYFLFHRVMENSHLAIVILWGFVPSEILIFLAFSGPTLIGRENPQLKGRGYKILKSADSSSITKLDLKESYKYSMRKALFQGQWGILKSTDSFPVTKHNLTIMLCTMIPSFVNIENTVKSGLFIQRIQLHKDHELKYHSHWTILTIWAWMKNCWLFISTKKMSIAQTIEFVE